MLSLNRVALSIKAAALNHKQVKQVAISHGSEPVRDALYPLVRIWPNTVPFSNTDGNRYKKFRMTVAVMDRHLNNANSQLEAVSDSEQILSDIVASLEYILRGEGVKWLIEDEVQPFFDAETDVVGGVIANIEAWAPYTSDFCAVPSHDYDFPAVGLFAVSIIDEGFSDTTYTSNLTVDGGIA